MKKKKVYCHQGQSSTNTGHQSRVYSKQHLHRRYNFRRHDLQMTYNLGNPGIGPGFWLAEDG